MGQSGLTWFIDKTDNDLSAFPILLARAGYDVWIGNSRGSINSSEHLVVENNNPWYWDFSFAEIGLYDLPAMIDYIYEEDNEQAVTYIGHSQGTTAMFYGLAHLDDD